MTTDFGCARCYGDDAQTVLAYYYERGLESDQRVVDDSHFGVSLRHCRECGQRFVWIFSEFVDWTGGEDAQYSDIVPVTADEAATVAAAGEDVDLRYLGSLGAGRRRLCSDWPTGGDKRIRWGYGVFWVTEGH
jgi:hypothetical protein